MKGSAKAPKKIMEAYYSDASNLFSETGVNLGNHSSIFDRGNLDLPSGESAMESIRKAISAELIEKSKVVALGGDHSVTYPIVQAFNEHIKNVNILHFDAHPDLYDDFEGNPYSHASPFARIMENNLADRLVQVGIRTLNDHQKQQAERFGVEIIEMKDFSSQNQINFNGPVYVSIDMDSLDPAFAPGVSHPEPGGLTTRDIIDVIHRLKGEVIGGDIVEVNPDRDINHITSMTAAKLLKELLAKMLT